MSYAKNPASIMRLLASSGSTVGTAAEDLSTFVDLTAWEEILVNVTAVGTVTATDVVVKFVHSTASAGTSPATVKGSDGTTDILATMDTPALGKSISLGVRTRGLRQFGSPSISTVGAACDVAVTVFGIGPRDSNELAAGWVQTTTATNTAMNAGVELATTTMS